MASLNRRSNPLYAIKECSSCGNLHTKDCGYPVHGLYCRQCALIRKTLEEVFQDFQDTSKSSNDSTNFVNQEPFVVKQGPGVNSSQSPPQINHNCCYECGDSLDGIFCQQCTCKSCGKGAHYGYNCPPQIPIISNPEPCYNQNLNEIPQNLQVTPFYYEEPLDSLHMVDEHLDTIPATESDEVIKSSFEELVLIPSESEGISDGVCDVPLCDNPTPLEAFKDHSEIVVDSNDDSSSSDDDSSYAQMVVEIVIPEVRGIDTDILLTIKDDILHEKLLNVNLLIANIEALKDNPTPSSDFVTNSGSTTTRSDLFLPDYEAFYDHIEEKSSGSTTTHVDFSQYDSFIFDLSIDSFLPADRSDFYHEEFAGELAHIISPPEYDHFYFKIKPELCASYYGCGLSRILEASRARGFCPSITRASNSQLYLGNPIS
ncbi:hypothetical protein Tco_0594289 [Tanacetum coccineum]